jgi:general secretion pathway protein N
MAAQFRSGGAEVTFKRGDRSEVLVLQRQEGPAVLPSLERGGNPAASAPQAAAAGGTSYASSRARSTPKTGEYIDFGIFTPKK